MLFGGGVNFTGSGNLFKTEKTNIKEKKGGLFGTMN